MECELVEIRFSLNGISDAQIQSLFNLIEKEEEQVILKRVSDPDLAISSDDFILEGTFSNEFLAGIARRVPRPLSCKFQFSEDPTDYLRPYSVMSWYHQSPILVGVTILPIQVVQGYLGFEYPTTFLNLILTTKAASLLKNLLIVKPKGLINLNGKTAEFVLINHRIDFIQSWLNKLIREQVDLDWLSGSTGEISEEIVGSVGFIDQSSVDELQYLLRGMGQLPMRAFPVIFRRGLNSLH